MLKKIQYMDTEKILFWNVDTQKDFIENNGKLYVKGAELIKSNLLKLTQLAAAHHINVVNTADYHFSNSAELDKNPDFIHTFPEHCMAGTSGAEFISETNPDTPIVFDWNKTHNIKDKLASIKKYRNIVIRKDAFDVFSGSPHTETILQILNPEIVIVYGVTTNVCVDYAVTGLAQRVNKVFVVKDAIKELPGIDLPFAKWKKLNIKLVDLNEVIDLLKE